MKKGTAPAKPAAGKAPADPTNGAGVADPKYTPIAVRSFLIRS